MNWNSFTSSDITTLCVTLSLYGLSSLYTYFSLMRQKNPPTSASLLNTSFHSHNMNTNRLTASAGSKGTRSSRQGREDSPPMAAVYASVDENNNAISGNQATNTNIGTTNNNHNASLGEEMRNYTIQCLAVSQTLRCVCILLEYYAYYHCHNTLVGTKDEMKQNYEITSIVAQTLPFQSFAIAYTGLVLFYHGVVATLSTSLNMFGTTITTGSSSTSNKEHIGPESQSQLPRSHTQPTYNIQSINQQSINNTNNRYQKNLVPVHGRIRSRLKQIHRYGCGTYCFFIVMNCIVPILYSSTLRIILDVYFSIWFSLLFVALIFFGGKVVFAFKNTIWNAAGSILLMTTTHGNTYVHTSTKHLGFKMVSVTLVCALGFLGRALLEAMAVWDGVYGMSSWENICEHHQSSSGDSWYPSFLINLLCSSTFSANMIGYIIVEWIPAITAVIVMKKRSNTNQRFQNDNVGQFITRKPVTMDRDAVIVGLEAGQGLPRVGSHGGSNQSLVDKSRSYSASVGTAGLIPRGNIGSRSHTHATSSMSGTTSSSTMKRSNSGVSSSETKALLGVQKNNTQPSVTSYGGL